MSNKKETPVRWLIDQFDLRPDSKYIKAVIDQALEMESKKQQKYDEMLEMLEKLIKEHESDTSSWTTILEVKQLIKEAKEL
jgi:DNA-binding SARP family transcriptional activator